MMCEASLRNIALLKHLYELLKIPTFLYYQLIALVLIDRFFVLNNISCFSVSLHLFYYYHIIGSWIQNRILMTISHESLCMLTFFLRHETKIDKQLENAQLAIQYIILQQYNYS